MKPLFAHFLKNPFEMNLSSTCLFVVLQDMHNHDIRERWNVETNSIRSPEGLIVTSTKTIQRGEEILYTYNYCTDCFDMGDILGTPGIYRDFGFLEEYPQYWPFLDQKVYATIDQLDDGKLQARFEAYSEVNAESLIFFKTQLMRLMSIDIETEIQSLTSSLEVYMVRRFYESLKGAILAVIEAGEMNSSHENGTGSEL